MQAIAKQYGCLIALAMSQLISNGSAHSQQNRPSAKFHVAKVSSSDADDWCTSGKCVARRIIVAGFIRNATATVEYKLECVDVIQLNPSEKSAPRCVQLHANQEYPVEIYESSISFSQANSIDYTILSEEESASSKR